MKVKRIAGPLLFAAALLLCLWGANRFFMRPDSEQKYRNFFVENEKTQPFDVFWMGTSHVFDGVFPMELFRNYGIASYNLGNSSELVEFTEWTLRLALQYHKPKLIMLDVYYVDRSLKDEWAYSYRHLFMDAMPLSLLKIKAITSTMPNSYWDEYLVPLSLYHGRWEEMIAGTTEMMVNSVPCMMGAEMRTVIDPSNVPYERVTEMNTEEMPGKEAIRRIAQICREEGIDLVLTAIPSAATREEQMAMNSCQLLADEFGVPFVNMFDVPDLVDFKTDLYDGISHLNPNGALKVTAYLGKWLQENKDLPDRRKDPAYANWFDILEEYEAYYDEVWGSVPLEDKMVKKEDPEAEQEGTEE